MVGFGGGMPIHTKDADATNKSSLAEDHAL